MTSSRRRSFVSRSIAVCHSVTIWRHNSSLHSASSTRFISTRSRRSIKRGHCGLDRLDRPATDLGWVCCQYRHHVAGNDGASHVVGIETGIGDQLHRVCERAGRRGRACLHQRPATTGVIGVFGDVGQHREVAERPNDVKCFGDRQRIEQIDEVCRIRVADRGPANRLDQVKGRSARLVGDDIAERPPEQTDVVVQRAGGVIGSG